MSFGGTRLRALAVLVALCVIVAGCQTASNPNNSLHLAVWDPLDASTVERTNGLLVAGNIEAVAPDKVARLDLTVEQLSTGKSWNGEKWVNGADAFRLATGDDGNLHMAGFAHRIGSSDLTDGDYRVSITGTSVFGESLTLGPYLTTVTSGAAATGGPESTILRPFDMVPLASDVDVVLRGYTSDPDGVASASFTITDLETGDWWNGNSWVTSPATVPLTLTDPGQTTTSWAHTIPASELHAGAIVSAVITAVDGNGAVEQQNVIPRPRGSNQHTSQVALPIYDVAPGSTRIWTIGDSITQQGGSFGIKVPGYRHDLSQIVDDSQCQVDWVGSLDWNWNEDISKQPDWTDRQHDGISAWSVYHTKNYVALTWQKVTSPTGNRPGHDLAAASGADIVMIHLGTNGSLDVTQDNAIPGKTAHESAQQKAIYNTADMQLLIDDVRSALGPDVPIMLAQIVKTHRPTSHPVPPLDTPEMINTYINEGYVDIAAGDPNVHLVDLSTGYDPEWNLDGLHPGNVGAAFQAAGFRQELADHTSLGSCL